MKIIQVCNFSSGISGVWTRVLEDSREFIKKGHEVHVFSSNIDEMGNKVDSTEAQKMTNLGFLTLAMIHGPTGHRGHISTVAPGQGKKVGDQ